MVAQRPEPGPWRHLPNLISLLRILAVGPLVWLLWERAYLLATLLALLAALSDGIDGYLARHYQWRSRLGGLLDPVADKLLLISCFVVLTLQGHLAPWLTGLVLGRDLLIVSGGLLYHLLIRPLHGEPTWLSKLNTVLQIVLIVWVLLGLSGVGLPPGLRQLLVLAVAASTVASGAQYVWIWGRRARSASHD